MTKPPTILINILDVEPGKQAELLSELQTTIRERVSTFDGWRRSDLIASDDGAKVVICSEWDSALAAGAMREDQQMQHCLARIAKIARFQSVQGTSVLREAS